VTDMEALEAVEDDGKKIEDTGAHEGDPAVGIATTATDGVTGVQGAAVPRQAISVRDLLRPDIRHRK